MQTKVVYLKGNPESDEATLNKEVGFRLQSVVHSQGQIVGYMVREPWAPAAVERPLDTRNDARPKGPISGKPQNQSRR